MRRSHAYLAALLQFAVHVRMDMHDEYGQRDDINTIRYDIQTFRDEYAQ